MLNLADHCLLARARDPAWADRTALVLVRPSPAGSTSDTGHDSSPRGGCDDAHWSFAALAARVTALGRGLLAIGLRRGDRVLLRLDNSVEYALAFFAANAAGLVPIPSSPQLGPEEVAFILHDSGARCLVVAPPLDRGLLDATDAKALLGPVEHVVVAGDPTGVPRPAGVTVHGLDALEHTGQAAGEAIALAHTGAEDPAYLMYTSGTTARPKGVLHAQRSVHGRAIVIREWEGIGPGDRICHAGTLNWTYTLGVGLMDPWSVGATAILYAGPRDPRIWPPLVERLRVTVFAAVPTLYRQILRHDPVESFDWSSLRHALSAGEPLPVAVHEEWRRRVGREIYEALGMSEVSTYISFRPGMTVRPGACGRPQAGRRIRLLALDGERDAAVGETGRIAVHCSDPGLMLRYWNRPDEEAAARQGEWFVGGDLAVADSAGVWWFRGRDDDIVKSLGYRISPVEVEAVLAAHPDVAECAVTAVPVGEDAVPILTAFVKLHADRTLDAAALQAHCRAHLAAYKTPRRFEAIDALPRTPNGKLLRRALVPPAPIH